MGWSNSLYKGNLLNFYLTNPFQRIEWVYTGGNSSAGRAPRCQRGCRGFESRFPLHTIFRQDQKDFLFGFLRRHSQVAKAAVCKTVIHRFESGCRLHKNTKGLQEISIACKPFFIFRALSLLTPETRKLVPYALRLATFSRRVDHAPPPERLWRAGGRIDPIADPADTPESGAE